MTSVWTRKIFGDTPLPKAYESSLRVAISVYQGTVTVSLSQLTRDGGRVAKTRNLWFDKAQTTPETYAEAVAELVSALARTHALLLSEGVG